MPHASLSTLSNYRHRRHNLSLSMLVLSYVVWTLKCWGDPPEDDERHLQRHVGKIVKVYIDDTVIKFEKHQGHLEHLQIIFNKLLQYNIRLNPLKFSFGLALGKLLGYLIVRKGIEANPEHIQAILEMPSPTNQHEIQTNTSSSSAKHVHF